MRTRRPTPLTVLPPASSAQLVEVEVPGRDYDHTRSRCLLRANTKGAAAGKRPEGCVVAFSLGQTRASGRRRFALSAF